LKPKVLLDMIEGFCIIFKL